MIPSLPERTPLFDRGKQYETTMIRVDSMRSPYHAIGLHFQVMLRRISRYRGGIHALRRDDLCHPGQGDQGRDALRQDNPHQGVIVRDGIRRIVLPRGKLRQAVFLRRASF